MNLCANVEHFLKVLSNENNSAQNDIYSVHVFMFLKSGMYLCAFMCLYLHVVLEIAYIYTELLFIVASSTGKVYILMFIYLFCLNIFLPGTHVIFSVKEKKINLHTIIMNS